MDCSRKLLQVVLISLLLLPLFNCGSQHSSDEKYYLISANLQVPYWQSAKAGFLQAGSQLHVKVEFAGPNTYDPKAQQLEFQNAVSQKASGILLSAANPELMRPDIDAAIAAGIPVITLDSDSPSSKRLFFIGTNNYQAGLMGGKVAASQMHGKGNIVVFTMPGQSNLDDRLRGYRDALANYPQLKIARVVDIRGDPRIAFDTAQEIIGKEKDKFDGFVCLEAQAGKEVANVLDRYKVKGKTVVAKDTDAETLDAIKRGVIAATISQKPFTMAFVGMKLLDDLHHHQLQPLDRNWAQDTFSPIPAFVDTGATLIDKHNVDEFLAAQKSAASK